VTHGSSPFICNDLPAVAHVNAYYSAKLLLLFCFAEGNRRGVPCAPEQPRGWADLFQGR